MAIRIHKYLSIFMCIVMIKKHPSLPLEGEVARHSRVGGGVAANGGAYRSTNSPKPVNRSNCLLHTSSVMESVPKNRFHDSFPSRGSLWGASAPQQPSFVYLDESFHLSIFRNSG
jgi:hypothetical protein